MLLFEAPVFGGGALDGDLDRVVAVAAVDGVDGGGQAGLLGAVDRVEQVGLDGRGGGGRTGWSGWPRRRCSKNGVLLTSFRCGASM